MELIRYFQFAEPGAFPFAAAIGAAVFGTEAVVLDCFVLVENRGPFLGLKRRTLPSPTTAEAALERMKTGLSLIHRNMMRAAEKRSRLPAAASLNGSHVLDDRSASLLRTLRDKGVFDPHLQWIGQKTISGILHCQIADLANETKREQP